MLHIFPLERLGRPDLLLKAQSRVVKYIKRERIYVKGKPSWRYWYKNDQQRTRHQKDVDPKKEHEHITEHEAPNIYESLKLALPRTGSVGVAKLEDASGADVTITSDFNRKHRKPFIEKESQGLSIERNPIQRVLKAFTLIPEKMRRFTKFDSIEIGTRAEFMDEFGGNPPAVIARGNKLYILMDGSEHAGMYGANTVPHGEPRFGSGLTLTEELILHEVGVHLRDRLMRARKKEELAEFRALHDNPNLVKISALANESWEDDFAQSFAAMLTHPHQLAQQSPERYAYFRDHDWDNLSTPYSVEEMKQRLPGEFAWWEHQDRTKAAQIYDREVRRNKGVPSTYHSEKDEFYSISVDGRTIYMRVGPESVEEEEGWKALPELLDAQTKLPKFDVNVSRRFNEKGSYKEFFDEHGNRLNDVTAYLYLRSFHSVVNDKIPDNVADYRPPSTHSVRKQVYDMLGHALGNQAKEREAVKKLISQGKLEQARGERYQWVPVKMTESEFYTHTPSFVFNGLRSAKKQPYEARDEATGAAIMMRNAQTGKKGPMLHARVYESHAPDGTVTQVTVSESPSFKYGDIVYLPITRSVKGDDGKTRKRTTWESTTLASREHRDITPNGLARQYKVTSEDLLLRNGRRQEYQILDPVLAALVNPTNEPIRDAHDLVSAMKNAAEVGAEAWVTLQVGTRSPPSDVHVKVRFDGAGSPLLVGEHWQRKLGLAQPRVSDLLRGGEIKGIDRVVERRPQKRKIEEGHVVYATVRDKVVLARLEERLEHGYRVNVLARQGMESGSETASQVHAIPENVDPTQPDIYFRKIRKPRHEIALYGDELRTDVEGNPVIGSGVVKVALPADGSWGFEEVMRMPGVRANDKGELILDVSRIDEFRERVGAFAMDQHVQHRMSRLAEEERVRTRQVSEKKIPMRRIVDSSGLARVDALLKGMNPKPNGRDFRLGSHQAEALQEIAENNYRKLIAHMMGTGKTITALSAIKMAKNEGQIKRTIIVVPPNVVKNWASETAVFTDGQATVVGTGPGAFPLWKPPEGLSGKALKDARNKAHASGQRFWQGAAKDKNEIVIVGRDYFSKKHNQRELRALGDFDAMVIDEGHGIQYKSARTEAVEEWSSDMKMLLLLTGTPFTNKLDTLPQYLRLLTNNRVDLGTREEFADRHLTESAVMRAAGARRGARMDFNPHSLRRLLPLIKQNVHVATSQDVRGMIMPAVAIDENHPTLMEGVQAMLYRANQAKLTPDDREKLARASALGEDERRLIHGEGIRRVRNARNIANSVAYKAFDQRRFITAAGEGGEDAIFRLPSFATLQRRFKGKWPNEKSVQRGHFTDDEYSEFSRWAGQALGRDYESLAGRSIEATTTASQRKEMKSEKPMNGIRFGAKVDNPDYGPEGAITRGVLTKSGEIKGIEHVIRNADGSVRETVHVPPGTRFIRDPRQSGNGVYYIGGVPEGHPDAGTITNDWDYRRDVAPVEEGGEGVVGEEAIERGQRPKEGSDGEDVNRSPRRRRERLMFDLTLTTGNAKTDSMERWIRDSTNPKVGGSPDAQFVLFGHNIGSSVRTMESKLRLLGYQDVNEALNDDLKAPGDRTPPTGRYFVTYLGGSATLGDRDINSDIFRKTKDSSGRDTRTSLFVHQSLYGTSGKPLAVGKVVEAWSPSQRKTIAGNFTGVEIPARVTAIQDGKRIEYRYAYDSALKPKEKTEVRKLAKKGGPAAEKRMNEIYAKHWTSKEPLNEKQIGVFNSTQFMVASDAAQVGLNWGNAMHLGSYDPLFSPMEEWQRFTRVARMLPPAIAKEVEPLFAKVSARLNKLSVAKLKQYDGNKASALAIVEDALDKIPDLRGLLKNAGTNPAAFTESILAQRAYEKMNELRPQVEHTLRLQGRTITGAPAVIHPETGELGPQFVRAAEITSSDVTNEIVENHITPWERELLKNRKYLVNVKRFLTSAEVPKYETQVEVTRDPETNRKKKVKTQVRVGNEIETPARAEKSVLMYGRAKQVPVERMFQAVQTEVPEVTRYDYVSGSASAFSRFVKPGEA